MCEFLTRKILKLENLRACFRRFLRVGVFGNMINFMVMWIQKFKLHRISKNNFHHRIHKSTIFMNLLRREFTPLSNAEKWDPRIFKKQDLSKFGCQMLPLISYKSSFLQMLLTQPSFTLVVVNFALLWNLLNRSCLYLGPPTFALPLRLVDAKNWKSCTSLIQYRWWKFCLKKTAFQILSLKYHPSPTLSLSLSHIYSIL